MAKWADFGISCVTNSSDGVRIHSVGAHKDEGETIGSRQTLSRAAVVKAIGDGTTFVTLVKTSEGKWSKGAAVKRYQVGGEWFIKTVSNSKACDNLDELPSC